MLLLGFYGQLLHLINTQLGCLPGNPSLYKGHISEPPLLW